MTDSLSEQANKAALDAVKAEKPQQFTVGAQFRDGKLVGGVTYDRTWKNGWGATAYIRAWYDDLPVTVNVAGQQAHRPTGEAGIEVSKKF